jgi:hypothetical protein
MALAFELPARLDKRSRSRLEALASLPDVDPRTLTSVLNMLDPFKDGTITPVGFPDSRGVTSLVMVDTQETTIQQPAGLAAGATWDLHVGLMPYPIVPTSNGSVGSISSTGAVTSSAATTLAGPYFALTGATGASLNPLDVTAAGTTNAFSGSYGALAQSSMYRIVAQAIEVVNTSADLYRNGMAYGYRLPANKSRVGYSPPGASALLEPYVAGIDLTVKPPVRAQELVNAKNTFEGDGRDGLYVINLPSKFANDPPMQTATGVGWVKLPGSRSQSGTDFVYTLSCGSHMGWEQAGGFVTGISQNSSFLVRYRTYIEIFPSVVEGNGLIRLAYPPVPHHPLIEEIINRVISEMPAGCSYTENPLGEWFSKVLDAVSSYAPVLGNALGTVLPGAGFIGKGLGTVASMAKNLAFSEGAKKQALEASSSASKTVAKALQKPNRKNKKLNVAQQNIQPQQAKKR